jgi:hypothetical protein
MSDRLFGVAGNERFEFALCPLVVEKGAAGAAKQRGELRPGIEELISTMRIASIRGRGGSALTR